MTAREILFAILALVSLAYAAGYAYRYGLISPEFNANRENKAVSFCVDNGGLARFDYAPGADKLTFVGCTLSRQQERP